MSTSDTEGPTAEATTTRWAHPGMRMVALFLAIAYAVGVPLIALLEYRYAIISQRFDYPRWFVYGTTVLQAVCIPGLLVERWVGWAAAFLSVVTVGAVVSHLRIGSPFTAVPALLFTLVQLWLIRTSQRASPAAE